MTTATLELPRAIPPYSIFPDISLIFLLWYKECWLIIFTLPKLQTAASFRGLSGRKPSLSSARSAAGQQPPVWNLYASIMIPQYSTYAGVPLSESQGQLGSGGPHVSAQYLVGIRAQRRIARTKTCQAGDGIKYIECFRGLLDGKNAFTFVPALHRNRTRKTTGFLWRERPKHSTAVDGVAARSCESGGSSQHPDSQTLHWPKDAKGC